MVVVADASVAIRGDLSGFTNDLTAAERATGGFAGRMKNILSPRNVIGAAGLFGIGLGVRQLVGYAADAADAFSQLQQTQRTTDEVFGDSASVIEDWARRSADAAGMSQQTVFQSASVMGQTLINMGFAADEAAEKTVMLQQRASEMAIAFGQTPERAILAITAAMRGERDTIEKFGVSIKQVDVNSRVAALGLDTSTAAAKKNSEAMAILDLVMEQTANQAGRFAESADDVAVNMAQAQARIDDFMATQVGPMFASIQLGAIKVAEGVASWRAPFRDAFDSLAMFVGPQRTKVMQAAEDMGLSFEELRQRIAGLMEGGAMTFDVAFDAATAATNAEAAVRGTARAVKTQLDREEKELETAAYDALADPIIVALLGGKAEAERIAGETPGAVAQALLDNQFSVEDAAASLEDAVENGLAPMDEAMQIQGFLSSKALADGLASDIPAVRQRSLELKAAAESRLLELGPAMFNYGYNAGASYAAGVVNSLGVVQDAFRQLATTGRSIVGIESEPKDHTSPLYGITKWGGNIVQTIADGIYGNLGTGSAASAALAGALVPSVGGGMARTLSPVAKTGGLGNQYHVHLEDKIAVRSVREIGLELRRLGEMGLLPGSLQDDD